MRNIAFFPVLVIIFLFSANNIISGEEITISDEQITVNKEQLTSNNEQITENSEQNSVNHQELMVNKKSHTVTSGKKQEYSFSIGQQYGFVHAQAVEIVYPTDTKGKYLSELLWDMKQLFYLGIQAEFGLDDIMSKAGFFSDLSFKAGFPGDTGDIEDRDWLSLENSNLTHYSIHNNKTREFFIIDFRNGASIPLSFLYIKPFLNFSWMRFSFSGNNGHGEYARGKKYDNNGSPIEDNSSNPSMYFPISDNPKIYPFTGEVITYEQNWLLLAPGFTLGTRILSPFSFDLSFQISPLTYCASLDNHLTTQAIYHDFTYLGLFLESAGNVSFNWEFIKLSIEFSYRYISDTKGVTYQGSQNSAYVFLSSNESGAGLSMMDTRFLFKFKF